MPVTNEPRTQAPDTGTGAGGGGPAARRILVPVRQTADAGPALALAASLRAARPPFPGSAGRGDHPVAGRPSHGRSLTHASG
jgi:hypothetical protein